MALDLILRWLHILGAVVLVGGTIFQWVALAPGAVGPASDVATAIRARWSKLVMVSSGLLLISGLVNFVFIVQRFDIPKDGFPGSTYHPVFGVKFLLAFGVFFLSSVLSGRSGLAERMRQQERMWLTVNMVLAVLVVLLAGVLKLADRSPKSPVGNNGGSVSDVQGDLALTNSRDLGHCWSLHDQTDSDPRAIAGDNSILNQLFCHGQEDQEETRTG